jgi:hypothetical protein
VAFVTSLVMNSMAWSVGFVINSGQHLFQTGHELHETGHDKNRIFHLLVTKPTGQAGNGLVMTRLVTKTTRPK